jgi:hypothetical protein
MSRRGRNAVPLRATLIRAPAIGPQFGLSKEWRRTGDRPLSPRSNKKGPAG